ncbi:lytic transglycosylase domain-containing protein [Streptacidiphilus sp. EB129]|uniref:lytic transglycosylase domain-containing protein n=1 Tax=Streptacidiphilus sp. EB129 TaxID=3156262 RepID=UPI0035143441
MAKPSGAKWLLPACAVVAVLVWGGLHVGGPSSGTAASGTASRGASPSGAASGTGQASGPAAPSASPTGWYTGSYDPAQFAAQVRTRAREAGVDPQLVLAILYNEDYKPHDPALERAWQRMKPDAAFGIANMHQAAFDQTKQGRSFAGRSWSELPDDPDLAIEAEAWYLHDLAQSLPVHRSTSLTEDELLALGYNTGPGNMRAFARGVTLGPSAQSYLDRLRGNWPTAGHALGS